MTMLPGRAVEMQKQGLSTQEIGEVLGVSIQQVVSWFGHMGYDPVAYHLDGIALEVLAGAALYPTLQAHGIGVTGGPCARVRTILRQRGINWHTSGAPMGNQRYVRRHIEATLQEGQMLCRECDVITPAHDSGLCPACRGEENADDERSAWLEFESGWLRRNLCGGKR